MQTVEFEDIPLLEEITPLQRSNLLNKTTTYTLEKGEEVFHEGDEADHVYFLLEGKVILQTTTFDDKPVVTDIVRPGELLGWSVLFRGAKMTATATCALNVRLARIGREDFLNELSQHCDTGVQVMFRIAELISRRLRESRSRLALHLSGVTPKTLDA